MRARILDDVDQDRPGTAYLVLAAVPNHATLGPLFGAGHEGDGAFYLLPTDAWVARELVEDRLVARIKAVRDDKVQVLAEASCSGPTSPIAEATLLVESDAEWSSIEATLRAGETWPLILAPRAE